MAIKPVIDIKPWPGLWLITVEFGTTILHCSVSGNLTDARREANRQAQRLVMENWR